MLNMMTCYTASHVQISTGDPIFLSGFMFTVNSPNYTLRIPFHCPRSLVRVTGGVNSHVSAVWRYLI